jgi:hypothetical protein
VFDRGPGRVAGRSGPGASLAYRTGAGRVSENNQYRKPSFREARLSEARFARTGYAGKWVAENTSSRQQLQEVTEADTDGGSSS